VTTTLFGNTLSWTALTGILYRSASGLLSYRLGVAPTGHWTFGGPRQRAKWYKINAHLVLPDYDRSLWIDGSLDMRDPAFITRMLSSEAAWTLFPHPDRDCVFDEAVASRGLRKYNGCPIEEQVAAYRSINHPEHWGLWCMTLMARNHRQPSLALIERRLWDEVDRWPMNDQIALPVVFREMAFRPDEVEGDFWHNEWFSHNMQENALSDHDD